MRRFLILVGLALAWPSPSAPQSSLRERMLVAEDARPQTEAGLAPLMDGLRSKEASLRRQAVRALGRLEQPTLIPHVAAAMTDADTGVRREAYNALGQLAQGPAAVTDVQGRLLKREGQEVEPSAWGVLAATLGRLAYTSADQVTRTEHVLARVLRAAPREGVPNAAGPDSGARDNRGAPGRDDRRAPLYGAPDATVGALEGFEALVRQSRKVAPPAPTTVSGLRAAATRAGVGPETDTWARARRFAWFALIPLGESDRALVEAGLADPDEEVRRLAMVAAGGDGPLDRRQPLIEKGLADSSPRVRYEALRSWGRQLQKTSCAPIRTALRDASPHVVLQAIDLLGDDCPGDGSPAGTLHAMAEVLTPRPGVWHAPAHAVVSLARIAPAEARKLLPRYAEHGTWQVRMYAAHAAGTLAALDELERLARDPHDNVREAALAELVRLKRPEAGWLAIDALTRRDYQLVLTATRALGVQNPALSPLPKADTANSVLQALDRITAEKRETSRDLRLAILDRLQELGWPDGSALRATHVEAIRRYLSDFDSAVARKAADVLRKWGGTAQPAPQPLPHMSVSLTAVEALRGARLRITMAAKGAFELRLLADEAPLTLLRVTTRAREGYYNGLTFHRVVPNFVIQGGGPGANEYMGDGPFMRDEVGLVSHRRGTVGISTRGRDTGDAQMFVNLVDLPRLDHLYTVLAEVVAGMDVVDAILEGDVIERVEMVR